MLLAYHPERTFMEIVGADGDGYGALTISMLDPTRSVPLLRYQTGDVARLLDPGHVAAALGAHGLTGLAIPPSLLALKGRVKEALPNGANVALYKDALYADPVVARRVTGATRLFFRDGDLTMHVQLARGQAADAGLEPQIAQTLPSPVRPSRVRLWAYEQFPFGMTLDYERKFPHYVPGEVEPG
jgi:phenylacetate-CoA ligase